MTRNIVKTNDIMLVTTNGWDGQQPNGEGTMRDVWVNENFPDEKLVKIYDPSQRVWCDFLITDKVSKFGAYELEYWN